MIRLYNSAFIFTTQIYENQDQTLFSTADSQQKAVGGASILHQGDSVVFLRRGQGNIRIARLMDSSFQPLRERLSALEKNIEETTRQLDDITWQLAREEIHQNPQRLRQLSETYHAMKTQVAEWTHQWESTALRLEELEKRFEESKPRLGNE